MSKMFFLEQYRHVTGVKGQTGAAIGPGDYIAATKTLQVYIDVTLIYGADADCEITILEADDVAGTNAQALAGPFQIWAKTDIDISDEFVQQADAASYTIDTGDGKSQVVRFKINPQIMTEGKTALAVNIGNSDVANIIYSEYHALPKYENLTLLTDL